MFKFSINKNIGSVNYKNIKLLLYSILIGLLVGIVGAIFRITLGYIENFRGAMFDNASNGGYLNWIFPVLFAIVGIGVSLFLIKKYAPESSGSGVQEIEGALDGIRPMRWKRVIPVKFVASLFSLGSGLLLGREGPTIQLGANIGKMVKDTVDKSDSHSNPLVSAGAAAGLACAFNAPFAGIIFVIEEMHEHFKFNFYSVSAIMISAGMSDFVVRFLISSDPVIEMTIFTTPDISELWLFILLGLLFSVVGYVYNKFLIKLMDFMKFPLVITAVVGGLIVAIVGILNPDMIGGGYEVITKVLDHSFNLTFLFFLFVVRIILSIFSYSTGVSGGIFAPMLTLGVIFGMSFGMVGQYYFPDLVSQPGVFAVAGMAGIFASTVRAPLTGLVLAIEMTSNYELILPLIVTTVTASVVTSLLGNNPIYSTLLRRLISNPETRDAKL